MAKNTILLAEDDERFRRLIVNSLDYLGYETLEAEDGVQALDVINENVDLIVVDISMPNMNGFELIKRIRAMPEYVELPVLVMTGLDSRDQRMTAIECGANDFISKPVDLTEVKVRVASLLRIRDFQKELCDLRDEAKSTMSLEAEAIHGALDRVSNASDRSDEVMQDTLESLALAVEQRDVDPSRHLHRMSEYSALLAREAGMSEHEVEVLKMASLLHDVGKLAVRKGILQKPGVLSSDERSEMQVHANVGAKMLERSKAEFMNIAEIVARTHHEKWDGSGYPEGLADEDIPLVGRICAIADVFDALTSPRAYKEAFSFERSWKIMEEGRGTHFDPHLLDLFLKKRQEVEDIWSRDQSAS